ncbi:GGDEF domain-containing protein [Pseudoalteromonas aurantia]|uniref:GGDEF domain-containing protein n=1 Tax=Pseudoalteromonas aurantia TaxID=43654 RepID=UPI00110BBEFA|nr:GGDEF domain-containing protein [Pseudoalteromonas aurantia]TMO58795.1 GGDEF domain-containing protein [Pseudoalteromonas aurantia]
MLRRTSLIGWLCIGFFTFIASLISYVGYSYHTTRQAIMDDIDTRLLHAAKAAQLVIGNDYHDRLNNIEAVQFEQLSAKLTALASALDVEYVYTMIYDAPLVRFTSSSYTQKDLKLGHITQFLDPYFEATVVNKGAFRSTEPVFEISEDQWGHFKTILVPFVSSKGTVYITGADITTDDVAQQLRVSIAKATLTACFFFFIALLVAGLYLLLYKKSMTSDTRTGFANRIALERDLAKNKRQHLSLAIIWVSELEDIISFYGASVGDQVIQRIMKHFSEFTYPYPVYRLATSKLVIMCDTDKGEHYLTNLIKEFPNSRPVLNNPHLYVQLSAGIASGNKALLLDNAYVACRQAKQQNKTVCLYAIHNNDGKQQQANHLALAHTLQNAFEKDRVVAYFTPRFDVKKNAVTQHMCSARIINEQGAILGADIYQKVVKRSRMEGKLTHNILTQCVTRFRKKNTAWSLKLSYQDATDPQLIDIINQELRRYPQPALITFELDEQAVLNNFNSMAASINMLKSKGVKILINGVSSGLLTVSRVMKLNIDAIKLDEHISAHMHRDEQVFEFISHLAKLCKDRDIQLVVGAVLDEAQFERFIEAGVDMMQGRHIGRATPHIRTESHLLTINP